MGAYEVVEAFVLSLISDELRPTISKIFSSFKQENKIAVYADGFNDFQQLFNNDITSSETKAALIHGLMLGIFTVHLSQDPEWRVKLFEDFLSKLNNDGAFFSGVKINPDEWN